MFRKFAPCKWTDNCASQLLFIVILCCTFSTFVVILLLYIVPLCCIRISSKSLGPAKVAFSEWSRELYVDKWAVYGQMWYNCLWYCAGSWSAARAVCQRLSHSARPHPQLYQDSLAHGRVGAFVLQTTNCNTHQLQVSPSVRL